MFTQGQKVTWMYEARGGYGYVIPVPATVVKVTNKGHVCIDADLKTGGVKRKYVKPDSLKPVDPLMDILFVNG